MVTELLIVAALAAGAQPRAAEPAWQRQTDETCAQYGQRIAANGYELWNKNWCVKRGTTCDRMSAPKALHPYWEGHQDGCSSKSLRPSQ